MEDYLGTYKNRPRTVVFYGRVSTEHEQQISALGNQMEWYTALQKPLNVQRFCHSMRLGSIFSPPFVPGGGRFISPLSQTLDGRAKDFANWGANFFKKFLKKQNAPVRKARTGA